MKQKNFILWFGVGVIIFIVFKILSKFGLLGKDEEEKNAEALFLDTPIFEYTFMKKVLAPAFIKKHGQSKATSQIIAQSLPLKKALELIETLKSAKGVFNDDEDAVYGVFRQLPTQYHVHQLWSYWQQKTNSDLVGYLRRFLDENELSNLYTIINKKPLIA